MLTKEEKRLLKYLIAKGIPDYFRQNLWILCSRAKADLANNTTYYEDLLKLSKEVPSLYEKQIDKDIKRTINDNLKNNENVNSYKRQISDVNSDRQSAKLRKSKKSKEGTMSSLLFFDFLIFY